MEPNEITLPFNYTPRNYQLPFLRAMDSGKRFGAMVWHRRAGKDITCWNYAIKRTVEERMTTKYCFPTNDMAKDNLWDAYTNDGMRFTDFVPKRLRTQRTRTANEGLNETYKEIELITGGSIRVISTQRPERMRGGNSKLFVLSEFQQMDPRVVDIIEPIIEANGGMLIVNLTPAGDNHAKGSWEAWQNDPDWFTSLITAEDTTVFSPKQLENIKRRTIERFLARGLSEEEAVAFYEQEYFCSFESPVVGSYFGAAMRRADKEGRITRVPWEPSLTVNTYWDLGIDDSMSIWFTQLVNREVRLIDYFESSGEGLAYYAKELKEMPYAYGSHYAPHDIAVRELGTGVSRLETAASLGLSFTEVARPANKEDGIEAIRNLLARCWFDKTKCRRGINGLKGYKKEWNDKLLVYKNYPVHDWTSHPVDAFQTMALSNPQPAAKHFQQRQKPLNFQVT